MTKVSESAHNIRVATCANARLVISVGFNRYKKQACTVAHQPVDHYTTLSIIAVWWIGGNYQSSGSVSETCDAFLKWCNRPLKTPRPIRWAEGWGPDRVADLARFAGRWHLNDLRLACIHQKSFDENDRTHDYNQVCPVTGYRYGKLYLIEPLTPEAKAELTRLTGIAVG